MLALLVLVGGLGLSLALWNHSRELSRSEAQVYFEFRTRDALSRIEQRLLAYEQVLRGVSGLFRADRDLNRAEFAKYVTALSLDEHFPGIQGVGYSLAVQPERLAQHIAAIRKEGFPTYTLRPEGQRPLYTSIIYLEPFRDRNLRAFGYDMFSEPIRKAAMERARDLDHTAISGKVKLVQETEQDVQAGFLMYVPVYREGAPLDSIGSRRRHLLGWAYSPFRMNDLMNGVLGERAKDLDIEIYDGREVTPASLLFDSEPQEPIKPARFSTQRTLEFAGQVWTLRVRALPGMFSLLGRDTSSGILFFGGLASLLAALLTWILARGRDRALNLERQRLADILRGTNAGTWEWNVQTGELTVNARWADLVGYTLQELEPISIETWLRLAHPDDLVQSEDLLTRHFSRELDYYHLECRMKHRNGEWIWVLDRGKVMSWTPDGKPLLMSGTHQEITQAKRAEAALKDSEENFRVFFETMDDMIFVATLEGGIRYANPAATLKLGYSPEDLATRHLLELHPLPLRMEATEIFGAMVRHERDSCPLPLQTQEGKLLPVETRVWLGHWNGEPCVYGISKDLSRQEAARQKFDRLFHSNPALMAVSSSADQRFTEVNQAFLDTLGYRREEVIGRTSTELGLFVDPEVQAGLAWRLSREGRIAGAELKIRQRDGRILTGLFSGEVIDSQGEPSLLTVMLDTTGLRIAETERLASETRMKAIVQNAPIGIIRAGLDGNIQDVNPTLLRMLGYDLEELLGTPLFQFTHPDFAQRDLTLRQAFMAGDSGELQTETCWIRKEGQAIWVSLSVRPVRDDHGVPEFFFGMVEDISEWVRSEKALADLNTHLNQRVAEEVEKNRRLDQVLIAQGRQAAMGEMIGHIAHQWRQPLGALGLVISNIRDAHRLGRLTTEFMEQSRNDSQRLIQKMSSTINDFMNFFRQNKEEARFSVLDQVHQSLALVDASFKHNRIVVSVEGASFEVWGSANEFSQVLLNLLSNAKDAILDSRPEGGSVTIRLEQGGPEGVVRILDNGGGIPAGILDRIFDPYFSTKELGTGIGLYMSRTIVVRSLKGRIEARNIDGGAEISLHLPLLSEVP